MNPFCLGGYEIYENIHLTEPKVVTETKSVRERWIEPILHMATVPFEPWVKIKRVVSQVPSSYIYKVNGVLIMHPEQAKKLREQATKLSQITEFKVKVM